MALHDRDVTARWPAASPGLSVAADSLSAIKYARVKPVRDHHGLAVDFVIEGDSSAVRHNDDRLMPSPATWWSAFMRKIQALPTWRQAVPTQSILTITSNVVYGQKTG